MSRIFDRLPLYCSLSARRNLRATATASALLAASLTACAAPAVPEGVESEAPPSIAYALPLEQLTPGKRIRSFEAPVPLDTPSQNTVDALRPTPERLAALERPIRRAWDRPSNAASLARPVQAASYSREKGQAVAKFLALTSETRRLLGAAGLTFEQVFGDNTTPPICEDPAVDATVQDGGETFEVRYRAEAYTWITAPVSSLYALTATCTNALRISRGTVQNTLGSACSLEDEAAHFPANSTCRTCLQVDGDHARCVSAGACKLEMNREMGVRDGSRTYFYDVLEAAALVCAPDYRAQVTILVNELGEDNTLPAAFDHSSVVRWCVWFWSSRSNQPELFCNVAGGSINLAISDVALGWVVHVRRPGETTQPYFDRLMISSGVEVEGVTYAGTPLYPGTIAEVSTPEASRGGWGFNPQTLRPDGTDLSNIDHTHAREWIGGIALKTATTIDGVPIAIYNRNLCPESAWRGPDSQGRYYCPPAFDAEPPPDQDRWRYDYGGYMTSLNPLIVDMLPHVTLATTGRMDPNIPGGHVPKLASSAVLGDPDWENCTYPDTFVPDEMANIDVPTPGQSTFSSQTYRFGKNPQDDIRLVLATAWRRNFCFEALPDR